jgi:aspartyl-tRNA(Asn)/glutamyl-tRNA(Gln) amidotransferase subunit C
MKLSSDDIEHIASLARLKFNAKEKASFASQLSSVLDYIGMLNEINTENITETCQVTGLEDVTRDDKPFDCDEISKKKMINQFPDKFGDLLKVKGVFE